MKNICRIYLLNNNNTNNTANNSHANHNSDLALTNGTEIEEG